MREGVGWGGESAWTKVDYNAREPLLLVGQQMGLRGKGRQLCTPVWANEGGPHNTPLCGVRVAWDY
jgi:hypothetical protein